jgi:uncharacterized membrane protein
MKKHVVLISVGILNLFHGLFHVIQFVQSLFFVAYATHGHQEDHDTMIDKIMHHPIFAIIMGIIGILTLIIGIKDYRHHKACETHEHHDDIHEGDKLTDVLSSNQLSNVLIYYLRHKKHIDHLVSTTEKSFSPSQIEDKNDPMIWKAEYWKWFLSNLKN